ncbi:DUF2254 domain-containing protein [Planococcus lenghuensis]|uniref:DUF2254 domain-containing protein n=1 Tax=Planococcus lenghuensis TaxID=2213202 RepID=A0A1Q2L288_9BACL|nr:DUF2254 domain-containing protein [Planococcus lenghuensis]AQQ54568.1 hypothetical protein B0X71_16635 [Planococcus lenghuensis]
MPAKFLPREIRKYFLMPKRQRKYELRMSLWRVPLIYVIAAIVLAITTLFIDLGLNIALPTGFIVFSFSTTQLLVSTLIGSLLLLAAYTLNILLVVLTTFSGQFSPRMLQDFVSTRQLQNFVGVFNGSFVYVLVILLFMNNFQQEEFVLVPLTTVLVMFIAAINFLFFINHAIYWMQVHNVTGNMRKISEDIIRKSLTEDMEKLKTEHPGDLKEEYRQQEKTVKAADAGYIQLVDFPGIVEKARNDDIVIALHKRIGDFILSGNSLFSYWGPGADKVDEEAYKHFILFGNKETEIQDNYAAMSKLAEIAIKAMANGDPRSAINAIYQLAYLMQTIDEYITFTPYLADEDEQVRIITREQRFEESLYRGFGLIRHYAKGDLPIIVEIVSALQMLAQSSESVRHTDIWRFVENTVENVPEAIIYDIDKRLLLGKLETLAKVTGNEERFDNLKKAIE